MYMISGPAATFAVAAISFIAVAMLLFSFRETTRGIREFFDLAALRSFLHSVRRFRLRYSLRAISLAIAVLPPCIAYFAHEFVIYGLPDPLLIAFVLAYCAVVVAPLAYWFYIEAFGSGPRDHWRKYLQDHQPHFVDSQDQDTRGC